MDTSTHVLGWWLLYSTGHLILVGVIVVLAVGSYRFRRRRARGIPWTAADAARLDRQVIGGMIATTAVVLGVLTFSMAWQRAIDRAETRMAAQPLRDT